jgi:hypothetical protein
MPIVLVIDPGMLLELLEEFPPLLLMDELELPPPPLLPFAGELEQDTTRTIKDEKTMTCTKLNKTFLIDNPPLFYILLFYPRFFVNLDLY